MNHTRIGIILPSGGCKCAFQAGVLKAIEKLIPAEHIHYLQGVSGGILNGAKFISDDSKADGLIELWKEVEEMGVGRLFDLCTVVLNQIGKNKPNTRVEELLSKLDIVKILNSHTHLDIVVRNLETNEAEVFSSRNFRTLHSDRNHLTKLILASASIPGMMPPVRITNTVGNRRVSKRYCDGFVWLPEALENIKDELDLIIVIDPEHQVDPFASECKPFWIPAGSWKSLGGSNYIYFDNLKKSLRMLKMIVGKEKVLVIKPVKTYPNLTVVTFSKGEISDSIDQGYKLTSQALRQL